MYKTEQCHSEKDERQRSQNHAHQVQDKSVVMFLTYRNPYTRVSGIHLMMEGLQPY